MSEAEPRPEDQIEEEEESIVSSEDDDAQLLTDKVEEKLLATIAKIRSKHPSIYNTTVPLFQGTPAPTQTTISQQQPTHLPPQAARSSPTRIW